jgi:FimV-like protein
MRKFNLLLFCGIFCTTLLCEASSQTYGPIKKGELLWNVATKLRADDSVSQYQIMLALLKANPEAFSTACNINSLKQGVTIRVPSLTEIQTVSREEARKEYQRQDSEWKAYRRNKQEIVCPTVENQQQITEAVTTTTTAEKTTEPVATAQNQETTVKPDKVKTTAAPVEAKPTENAVVPTETTPQKTAPVAEPTAEVATTKPTASVESPQQPSNLASNTTTLPEQTTETRTTPQAEVNSPTENTALETPATDKLFSGKIIAAIIVSALLLAFLIGWLLHKIVQSRKPPAETLENHPLFDSIDKVLLTGQLPKN